jgi:hypothetical protein
MIEKPLLRLTLYVVFFACVASALPGPDRWSAALGALISLSALAVSAPGPGPRVREPWEHADSFRIGPPPEVPADPARRLPSGASRR